MMIYNYYSSVRYVGACMRACVIIASATSGKPLIIYAQKNVNFGVYIIFTQYIGIQCIDIYFFTLLFFNWLWNWFPFWLYFIISPSILFI